MESRREFTFEKVVWVGLDCAANLVLDGHNLYGTTPERTMVKIDHIGAVGPSGGQGGLLDVA